VRNDKIKVVKDIPLITKIVTPTGKVFEEYKKDLNEQGSFELSFTLPEYSQTGSYSADVYTGSKQLVGSYKFKVEEFVPDKIRVNVKSDKEKTKPGDKVTIDVAAEFLFGAPAAEMRYETDIQLNHKSFRSKNHPGYAFSNSSITNSTVDNTFLEGQLDSEGKTKIEYKVPDQIQSKGVITGTAYVSVFDLTGRTVTRSASFDVYPKDYFIGIKSTDYYYGVNENINFNLLAVDQDDKQISNFTAKVHSPTGATLEVIMTNSRETKRFTVEVPAGDSWEMIETPVEDLPTGIQHVKVVLNSEGEAHIDWVQFN